MISSDTSWVVAKSSLPLTDAPASSSSVAKSADFTKSSSKGELEGREVIANPFSEWFRKGLREMTQLHLPLGAIVEGYMMDAEILERICYQAPSLQLRILLKCSRAPTLPDRILLNEVFMKTIPLPFVPSGPPNPEASAMLEGFAKSSMQNLSRVNLGGVLLNFATASAGQPDVVERIHMHLGKFITDFAPRLRSLTLQLDFNVTPKFSSIEATQYKFNAALLKKYLPKHVNAATMTITLVRAPMIKYVTLDLTNRRLHGEIAL